MLLHHLLAIMNCDRTMLTAVLFLLTHLGA
jgi:hypothetical protein